MTTQPYFDKAGGYSEPDVDFYSAVVISNKDPEGLERLKVRIFEFHGDGTKEKDAAEDDLPWAAKLRPTFRGASLEAKDLKHSREIPKPDLSPSEKWPANSEHITTVIPDPPGDGSVIPGIFGVPREGSRVIVMVIRHNANSLFWISEQADGGSQIGIPNYGNTYGRVDENGNVAYIDVQDNSLNIIQFGNCYINITGTVWLNIKEDANVNIYGNLSATVAKDATLYVGGDVNAHVVGNVEARIDGNLHTRVAGTSTIDTLGTASIRSARSLNLESMESINLNSPSIALGATNFFLKTLFTTTFSDSSTLIIGSPVNIVSNQTAVPTGLGGYHPFIIS